MNFTSEIIRQKVRKVILLLCFSIIAFVSHAQSLTVTGSWTPSFPTSLITEAGSNYANNFTSNSNQSLMAIVITSNYNSYNNAWRLDIRKSDTNWHSNLVLRARRTGSGTNTSLNGTSTITGGSSYQTLTNSNASFFTGAGNRNNIPIQYRLQGVSLIVPAGNYSTTIVYTLVDI